VPHRFDAILRHLPEEYPQDWAQLAGVEPSFPVAVIDADLSTVTAAADKVLQIGERDPWLLHLEFQANYDQSLSQRMLQYNVLLGVRHSLPVRSVAILLRPGADGKTMTGQVDGTLPNGTIYLKFGYEVIRLWQLEPAAILAGGIGILPLLPLTRVERPELPQLIREMKKRFQRRSGRADIDSLWTATYVLMGLEYEEGFASRLLQGVGTMKESVTYQAILKEGREKGHEEGLEEGREEARRMLLAQGTKRFGKPSSKVRKTIEAIAEPSEFERLGIRLLDVESWADLLAEL
jgi:predicted transposase YdaD